MLSIFYLIAIGVKSELKELEAMKEIGIKTHRLKEKKKVRTHVSTLCYAVL